MKIAFATDTRSPVTDGIKLHLQRAGHEVIAVGDGIAWPDAGRGVGEAVAAGEADFGIVCCWTGTGVSIAANKVPGVRAALCTDAATAEGARRWNDANVLAMGLRLTSDTTAAEMIDAFLASSPDPSESAEIAKFD